MFDKLPHFVHFSVHAVDSMVNVMDHQSVCTSLGCRIGHSSDIRQCSTENHSLIPCTIKSAACSAVPNGRCTANGLCCGTGMLPILSEIFQLYSLFLDACQMDESCPLSSDNLQDESQVLST